MRLILIFLKLKREVENMSYPLIILGAGASFDFLRRDENPSYDTDLDQYIPPLTNRIFDGTKFHEIIAKYPEMHRLVDYIRVKLRADHPETLEQILDGLYHEKVKIDKSLYISFISLLFYICDLFGTISKKYYRPNNNYGALLKMISFQGNRAVFVNFNYDLLFEQSLKNSNIESVDEYISGELPIIKIHGAFNWYWARPIDLWGEEDKSSYELSLNNSEFLINAGENIKNWKLIINKTANPQRIMARGVNPIQGYAYHPALALPIIGKNNYVCPESHIQILKSKLSEIDRVVIVGWKLGDPFLRDLIIEELKRKDIPIAFIGSRNTNDLIKSFDEKIRSNIKLVNDKGFSNFLSSNEGEDFFSHNTKAQ